MVFVLNVQYKVPNILDYTKEFSKRRFFNCVKIKRLYQNYSFEASTNN
jgi:hypothetical protein